MTQYWDSYGPKLTEETLKLAMDSAKGKGIKWIVVSSTTGRTARMAADLLPEGINLVVVAHVQGYNKPGENEFDSEDRAYLEQRNIPILVTTHLFGNVERAVANKWGGLGTGGIVSATLRMFGQGTKVCAEIGTMALDAGLIPYGEDIIACGGSARGVDTALIMRPAHAHKFFDGEIREIVAKPTKMKD